MGRRDGSNAIELLREMRFPHSLGLLYSAFTAFLGFEVNEGEYKVMGMAPYGEPRYEDEVRKVIDWRTTAASGWTWTTSAFHHSLEQTYSRKFDGAVRPAARPARRVLHPPQAPVGDAA